MPLALLSCVVWDRASCHFVDEEGGDSVLTLTPSCFGGRQCYRLILAEVYRGFLGTVPSLGLDSCVSG